MATYSRKLKDAGGNYITPATRASCVYLKDNKTLQSWIDSIESRVNGITNEIYPVGAIYQSTNGTSPASLGGSWNKIENRFLYSSGSKSVGSTGGEELHTLSITEMPIHHHTPNIGGNFLILSPNAQVTETQEGFQAGSIWTNVPKSQAVATNDVGGGNSHNNMPPYEVVNIWKRVS